jgi:hypothetical protein
MSKVYNSGPVTDQEARTISASLQEHTKSLGGMLYPSLGFSSQPAVLVLILPDGTPPSQVAPDIAWLEVVNGA